MKGTVEKVDLTEVSCDHFASYISTAKSLEPVTKEAVLLLHSVEQTSNLRRLLCQAKADGNWEAVCDSAAQLQREAAVGNLSECVSEELQLIKFAAEDIIMCNCIITALKEGGPIGSPGAIDISNVNTTKLAEAIELVANMEIKSQSLKDLLNACGIIKSLRQALLKTAARSAQASIAAWESISLCMKMIDEYKFSRPDDTSLQHCATEVALIRHHSTLQIIHADLRECLVKASHVYFDRNASPQRNERKEDFSTAADLNLELSTEELQNFINRCENLGFTCSILDQYVQCASFLMKLRSIMNKGKWLELKENLESSAVVDSFGILPEARKELSWISCEADNHIVIDIINRAMESYCISNGEKFVGTVIEISDKEFSDQNRNLEIVLVRVDAYKVTSIAAQNLLSGFKHLISLRNSIEHRDYAAAVQMLQWFRENDLICSLPIQSEAQQCYIRYQNVQLEQCIKAALGRGKPLGLKGDLNKQSIEIDNLQKLLDQSRVVRPLTKTALAAREAANVALRIRKALITENYSDLRKCVEDAISSNELHPLIMDEIAVARCELDNQIVIEALSKALHFPEGLSYAPISESAFSENEKEGDFGPIQLDSFFQASVLEDALIVADEHGIQSEAAERLHRTVLLIQSCRKAIQNSSWDDLESALLSSDFFQGIRRGILDGKAERELRIIYNQMQLRRYISQTLEALKDGSAKCANGIVDISSLKTVPLSDSLHNMEQTMRELLSLLHSDYSIPFDTDDLDNQKIVNRRIEKLFFSAKTILKVRDNLKQSRLDEAMQIIKETIANHPHLEPPCAMEEINTYSKEINAAFAVLETFEALRDGIVSGDSAKLESLLLRARESYSFFINDMGLIRIFSQAEMLLAKFRGSKKLITIILVFEIQFFDLF